MNAPVAAPRKVWTEAELQALPEDGYDHELGFRMNNLNVRAPDISFVSGARLKALGFKVSMRRFFPGAPNLAVEVLSLNNTRKEIDGRLEDFFGSGTQLAWIIDPESKNVEVCHSPTERRWIGSDEILDGEDLLPGFSHPVAALFKTWDWE